MRESYIKKERHRQPQKSYCAYSFHPDEDCPLTEMALRPALNRVNVVTELTQDNDNVEGLERKRG
jgi:hypothetical protein